MLELEAPRFVGKIWISIAFRCVIVHISLMKTNLLNSHIFIRSCRHLQVFGCGPVSDDHLPPAALIKNIHNNNTFCTLSIRWRWMVRQFIFVISSELLRVNVAKVSRKKFATGCAPIKRWSEEAKQMCVESERCDMYPEILFK